MVGNEIAEPYVGVGQTSGEHERRILAESLRQRLHGPVWQRVGGENHRAWIAAPAAVGEDARVDDLSGLHNDSVPDVTARVLSNPAVRRTGRA